MVWDKKIMYSCEQCSKYSLLIKGGGERNDIWGVLYGFFTDMPLLNKRELACLHCGSKNIHRDSGDVKQGQILEEVRLLFAHCKNCEHDTQWPAGFSSIKCEKCGTPTTWQVDKIVVKK